MYEVSQSSLAPIQSTMLDMGIPAPGDRSYPRGLLACTCVCYAGCMPLNASLSGLGARGMLSVAT